MGTEQSLPKVRPPSAIRHVKYIQIFPTSAVNGMLTLVPRTAWMLVRTMISSQVVYSDPLGTHSKSSLLPIPIFRRQHQEPILWRRYQPKVCTPLVFPNLPLISRISLPQNIETAVCNEGIKLQNFLYNLFWNTGAWYVVSACRRIQLLTVYPLDLGSSKYKQQTLLGYNPLTYT